MPKRGEKRTVREARPKFDGAEMDAAGVPLEDRFPDARIMGAGEFKAKCLKLMDLVERTGVEIVITKHDRPVARLAPLSYEHLTPFVGRSPGIIIADPDDLMAPVNADWMPGEDL